MGTCQELCRMLIFYTNCWKCYSVTPLSAEVSENVRSFCPVCAKHWNCQEKRPQQKHFNANGPLPTGVHRKGQNLSLSTFSNAIEALNVALGAGVSFLRNPPFYFKKKQVLTLTVAKRCLKDPIYTTNRVRWQKHVTAEKLLFQAVSNSCHLDCSPKWTTRQWGREFCFYLSITFMVFLSSIVNPRV